MEVGGICAVCGRPCTKCITCRLCGATVCMHHYRGGACANCLQGKYGKGPR